jgi:hypothetical protein
MGIHAYIKENRGISVAIAVVVITAVVVEAVIFLQPREHGIAAPRMIGNAYYSTDDGKSLFVDAGDQATPFDHDGKPAVKVYLYTCDAGVTRWVQYLEKHDAGGTVLVKKPGGGDWIPDTDPRADTIRTPKRSGSRSPVRVLPPGE